MNWYKISLFFHCILVQLIYGVVNIEFDINGFSIVKFISKHGYEVEAHINIETDDGYLLDMFRIPRRRRNDTRINKPAVLLMHGLFGSAENFVISGPGHALAFYLADNGYDVWLGNARGTYHSRKHINLDPDRDEKFWHFSWHEIGVYDLPAQIDYIRNATNQNKIHYIGHSQGTTSFFVMASVRPEYNSRIKFMGALAPAAFISHIPNPGLKITGLPGVIPTLNFLTDSMGLREVIPNNDLLMLGGRILCEATAVQREICGMLISFGSGYGSEQLDRNIVPLIVKTAPAGASTMQLYHYGQGISSGEFRQYDFGTDQNLIKYGQTVPPAYNISKITVPVGLFYGIHDYMVSVKDEMKLFQKLPNCVLNYQVPYNAFNHLDFIFAKDAIKLVYSKVLSLMKQYV